MTDQVQWQVCLPVRVHRTYVKGRGWKASDRKGIPSCVEWKGGLLYQTHGRDFGQVWWIGRKMGNRPYYYDVRIRGSAWAVTCALVMCKLAVEIARALSTAASANMMKREWKSCGRLVCAVRERDSYETSDNMRDEHTQICKMRGLVLPSQSN